MVLRKDSEQEIIMRFSLAHIFSVTALAALTGTASMQGATFHLSTPAHWGEVVLAPGDYKLSLPAPSLGRVAFRIEGAGQSVFAFPVSTNDAQSNSASSYLKLSEIDGAYFIREFSSGATGKTFTFAMPKQTRHQEMAKGHDNSFALSVK
jgi:hypothetical protein